jgi:hypothetical protein
VTRPRLIVLAAVLLLVGTGCVGGEAIEREPPSVVGSACGLSPHQLARVLHGYDPRRSGELQIVPDAPNFIGLYRSHSGPWSYVQRVPIFLYGPGHVPAAGRIDGPATMADLAPTLAAHLGFDLHTPDGEVLEEAVDPAADPPKLVVVVVWDGGGRNVLSRWPGAWPTLRRLIPQGAWYEHAEVGSSPSVTPAIHATLGSGLYPAHHGLVDLRLRIRGDIVRAEDIGPQFLRKPTLADLYDRAMDNVPLIGTVALDEWHLTMAGKGAAFPGGDQDLAALWNTVDLGSGWELTGPTARAFTLPPYLARFPGLLEEVRTLDAEDGKLDGLWLGQEAMEEPGEILLTPAFARWQTQAIGAMVAKEGFGDDEVPDLLFTNFKQIDRVSHLQGMETRFMQAVVRSSDQALADLVQLLDREVGRGEWVLAVTADHGSTPPRTETGAFLIDRTRLLEDIQRRFDPDDDDRRVVDAPRITQFWINRAELEQNGYTMEDVAGFVLAYTKGDNALDPSKIPEDRRDDLLFSAAFPGALLESGLPCRPGP